MWKQIRANGDMAVRQGYLWLGTPETKIYNGSRDGRELDNCLWQLERSFEATKLKDQEAKKLPLYTLPRLIGCGGVGGMLIWHEALAPSSLKRADLFKQANHISLSRVGLRYDVITLFCSLTP